MMTFSCELVLVISSDITGAPPMGGEGSLAGFTDEIPPCWYPVHLTHIPQRAALLPAFQGNMSSGENKAWRHNRLTEISCP